MDNILVLKGIHKRFGGVTVLNDINFSLQRGEVRALLGANGAGKSTLIKIIGGVHKPNEGEFYLNNKIVNFKSPNDAKDMGISIIHQELSLISTLNVIDNMFLGREKLNNFKFLDKKLMLKEYKKISESFNFNIDPYIKVSKLSIAKQQMIEIMKAVSCDSDIIIMDEPTTSLTDNEKINLFNIIDKLKKSGKTIIYISHILEEIIKISDSTSIMRNGKMIGTYKTSELTKARIVEIMTGKEQCNLSIKKENNNLSYKEIPILEVKKLNRGNILKDISLKVYKGEVVGIAGLVGSRRTELVNAIYGVDKIDSGEVYVNGKKTKINSPKEAIKNRIGLIPEDRKNLGLILNHAIYKNSTLVQLDTMKQGAFLSKKKEYSFAENAVNELGIKIVKVGDDVKKLSGGNQQKVVVSRWLNKDMDLLIYDEPTKGIDIGAKEDIFKTVEDFSKKGIGIIFISSDLEEVIRVSDRILVMRNGEIVEELKNKNIGVKDIMNSILNV
ncbi:sugar ABC transporter ATP-binding protein [Clostridium lundense]|uniref:sugar ABC transporter ATP-binding protein n=1 Tax=Clostridium lundense TaxID=319475 RepID=UPI000488EE45|nr:sugar ABC transporter ATP-binding protein [Clostridium lundense]